MRQLHEGFAREKERLARELAEERQRRMGAMAGEQRAVEVCGVVCVVCVHVGVDVWAMTGKKRGVDVVFVCEMGARAGESGMTPLVALSSPPFRLSVPPPSPRSRRSVTRPALPPPGREEERRRGA